MKPPRIILSSEMGGGWGHLLPLRALAREFIQEGAKIIFLVREGEKAKGVFAELGVEVISIPEWTVNKTGFSLNYSQCVWGNGYWDQKRFQAQFAWWVDQFRTLKPNFVLSDFSPTALLAAQATGVPRGAIGTGFTLPPPVFPMPSLHPWLAINHEPLFAAEAQLVASIQKTIPGVRTAADLFSGASRFLTVFPELDHFEDRPWERYWGPILEKVIDHGFHWPETDGPRVFLYINSVNRCLAGLLDHLRRLEFPVVGHVAGLADPERRALESRTLKLCPSLVDLERAAREADLAVTQGGLHTTATLLLAGIPLLLCPEQLEQTLLAYRLDRRGLCEWLSPWTDPGQVGKRFDRLLSAAELAGNVAAFAGKYAGYEPAATVRAVAQACLEAAA